MKKWSGVLGMSGAMLLSQALGDQRTMSFNKEVIVVPAPGEVVIDGRADDWDLSAGVWSYNNPTIVDKYSVWTHLMWDEKGVYFLARFHDPTPMMNAAMGKDFSNSWRADCYQARVIFDDKTAAEHQMHINMFFSTPDQQPYMIVKHGGFRSATPYDATGPDRPDLLDRFGNTMEALGGKIAMAKWEDGKGYNMEAFWPWEYCRLNGQPLEPGEEFVFGIEAMWGNPRGETTWPYRLSDGIKSEAANRIFMFRARNDWGRAVIGQTGNLDLTQQQKELHAARLRNFFDYDTYGSVAINYTLPSDRDVTIAIDNADGVRVRNLFGQYPRKAGEVTDYWDGLNDQGEPVEPGVYTAYVVDHEPVQLRFVNSVYNAATPPWGTDQGTRLWGSNHGYPTTATTRGDLIFLGFTGTEGGSGLMRVNRDGIIAWADGNEILDVTIGDKYAYTLSRDSWIRRTVMRRFTIDRGQLVPFEDDARSPNATVLPDTGVRTEASIAYANGKLYVQLVGYPVRIYDAETGLLETEVPAEGMLAVTARDETLYALYADGTVATLNPDGTRDAVVFTAAGLDKPVRLGVSHDRGRFAISNQGTNQVFIFDASGNRLHAIGAAYRADRRPAGRFIETDLILPLGLDFDAQDRLWLAEARSTCRRVTCWSGDAELVEQFWGAADYGAMSGFVMTHDSTRFIAHGIEFELDPDPDPWTRPTAEKALIYHPDITSGRGFVYMVNGREYAVTTPGYNKQNHFIIALRDEHGVFRPRVKVQYGDRGENGTAWIDRNGNGEVDEGEVAEGVKGRNHYWSAGWIRPDLTILTADQWLYPIQGFTNQGVPLYDFANPVRPLNTVRNNLHAQGSTGTPIMDMAGNISDGINFHTIDGRRGSYPNPYGRHDGPAAQRGLLTAPFRTNGVVEGVPGVGSITALGGDRGEWFILSMDGLYLGNIGQDIKGEVILDETFIGQESFGGFIWRGPDDRIMVQLGGLSYRLMELAGLETTRKHAFTLAVSAEQIADGRRIAEERKRHAGVEPEQLVIARVDHLPTKPASPDHLQEETLIPGASTVRVQEAGNPARWWRAALAHDGRNLAIMYQVADPSPWKNAEGRFTHAFIGGDCVDLKLDVPGRGPMRLLAAPIEGRNTVVFWQRDAAEKVNPTTYVVENNPDNARNFDVVKRVPDAQVGVAEGFNGYSALVVVPLSELGLDPETVSEVKGIVGVIYSDPTGANRAVRLYWHDKATGLVSDVPSEARLNPANWGVMQLQK